MKGPVPLVLIAVCLLLLLWNLARQNKKGADFMTDYLQTKSIYEAQRGERLKLFQRIYKNLTESDWQLADFYNGLVPEVWCPWLVRVGRSDDGGKWMCRPWALPYNCAVYSLGVYQDTSFERHLQQISQYRCRLYAYDKTQPLRESVVVGLERINAIYIRALIGDHDDAKMEMRSVSSEMRAHGDESIEVLKIDIEESEFKVIPMLMERTSVCQILIEIHGSPQEDLKLIHLLASKGYKLFSYEINGKIHRLSEFSFIHEDCLERYDALPYSYYLHDVDK